MLIRSQDTNPLLKQGLQTGEDAALWMRQKAGEAVTAANLDGPLKQLDEAAAKGLATIEQRRAEVCGAQSEAD